MASDSENVHEIHEPEQHDDHAKDEQEELLDLNEVMHAFGIEEWTNQGPDASSNVNSLSLLVEVQGQRYILRERSEGLAGEDPYHRYHFQRYLQQADIPIPMRWQTPQGEPFVKIGEDAFELQQWPGGEQFGSADPRSLDWTAYAGTMLGRIHQASLRYIGPQHRWPSEAHIGGLVQSWLNLARNKADASEVQAIAAALSHWADQWETVLPSAMMTIGSVHGTPEFHIHGDYHPLNLRFNTLSVTAVMGFEASRWEKRLFEVAYALFYFSALEWFPGSGSTRPLMKRGFAPERVRQFLQAYGKIYPPARNEAPLLADALMLISPIATINGPLEDLFYSDESMQEELIEDVLERLAWASSLPAWLGRVRRSLAEMWV